MIQLADLFSVPEMYLMSTVTEFFTRNHIDYHPEILFRDVKVRSDSCLCYDNNAVGQPLFMNDVVEL